MPKKENFGEQFGMSQREQNEIAGRAIGEHLFSGMEEAMGGQGAYGAAVRAHALHLMRHIPMQPTRMPSGGTISLQDDTDESGESDYGVHAHYQHPSGWSVKWAGGPYADIHTPKGEPVEVFNFTNHRTGEVAAVTPHELASSLDEFVKEHGLDRGKKYGE